MDKKYSGGYFDRDYDLEFDYYHIEKGGHVDDSTIYLSDGQPISSSSTIIADEPYKREVRKSWEEEKWEYANDANDFFTALFSLGFTRISKRFIRIVHQTIIEEYSSDGVLLSSKPQDPEYGPWFESGQVKQSKGWGGDPSETSNWTTQPGVSIGATIPIGDKNKDKKDSDYYKQPDIQLHADKFLSSSNKALKDSGYDFAIPGLSKVENESTFYAKGIGLGKRNEFLIDHEDDVLLNEGDIIINPKVSVSDVKSAGFGLDSDIFIISPEQLQSAKIPNSVGQIPSDFDFLVITKIERSSKKDIRSKDGSYSYSSDTIRTWVDSYKIEN